MLKRMQRLAACFGMNLKRYYSPSHGKTVFEFTQKENGDTVALFYSKFDAFMFLEELNPDNIVIDITIK